MIAYIIGGSGFGGCVDYVTRRKLEERLFKEQSARQKAEERKYESNRGEDIIDHLSKDWKLISSSGDIRIYEGRKAMADDIARPSRQRKPVKEPVGHISLDFHPADTPRMTDELMAEVAQDYMRQMGLVNTPYIVVRHYDKAHPHCHIVFSRVDYDGKILTQTTNFKKNERVCKALNLKHRLVQGKSKLNTDVSKLRGKEKVRYQLVHSLLGFFLIPSVTDWNSYVDLLRKNGITVREKIGKSGRVNLYYGVGKHEFWYKKLDPFLSRENLEQKFKERREKQQAEKAQTRTSPQPQPQSQPKPEPKPKQPEPIVIPPLPDVVCGVKIDRLRQQAYQEGKFISIGICDPGGVVPINHWIWYDFDKREPVISRAYPSDHKIPEAFQRQLAAKQSTVSPSPGAGIRFSSPS
ncbi:relaxase/mobilization nuclease domain-containing protein, partial [uncultured Duncaniella sp.]|uniref:relaxase/mobilization nuclease domain-containing protein n=1 Tax=uncultured Duncaniella sp. TaxID=2768039 RepID=UPI0026DF97AF